MYLFFCLRCFAWPHQGCFVCNGCVAGFVHSVTLWKTQLAIRPPLGNLGTGSLPTLSTAPEAGKQQDLRSCKITWL